jgi:hypothetical protein
MTTNGDYRRLGFIENDIERVFVLIERPMTVVRDFFACI